MSHEQRFRNKVTAMSTLCSVLVVFLHAYAFNDGPQPTAAYHMEFFLSRVLAQTAVPVFFALSAFLFYRNFTMDMLPGKWKSRVHTLLIPYIIWNILSMLAFWFLAKLPFINTPAFQITPMTVLRSVIAYEYNLTFWFVYNLILLVALAPVVYGLMKNRYVGIAVILTLVGVYSFYTREIYLGDFGKIEIRAAVFYYLGAWCGLHLRQQVVQARFHWTGAAALAVAAVICYVWDWLPICYITARLLMIYGVFSLSDLAAEVTIPKFFQCSFPIYAMHNLILETFNKIFSFVLPVGSNWILVDYFGSTVMTILIICACNALLLKFAPKVHSVIFGGR